MKQHLILAIICEVAFYLLSIVMRSIPIGISYAIWSGVGIVLVALVGRVVFKQHLDLPAIIGPAIIGICMILGGVVVINLFSESTGHRLANIKNSPSPSR